MQVKHVGRATIATALLTVASAGSVHAAPIAATKVYHNAAFAYSISYPSSWSVVTSTGTAGTVAIVLPSKKAGIIIGAHKAVGAVTVAALQRGATQTFSGLSKKEFNVKRGQTTIGGVLFQTLSADIQTKGGMMASGQVYVGVHKKTVYVLLGDILVTGNTRAAADRAAVLSSITTTTFS